MAATAVRLGSCWVCNFDLNLFKTNFQLSSGEYPVAIISLGYIKE
nr:nitroreductase family protein [uncultured Parabacteroides sp.]